MVFQVEALVAYDTRGHFKRGVVPRRDCNPNDVLINIRYAGICHSDYHSVKAEWAGKNCYPMVPGHEIAGIVEETGTSVTKFKIGDRVGVGCFVDSCRSCEMCELGEEQYCKKLIPTYNGSLPEKFWKTNKYPDNRTYGGYTQKIVVDENYVVKIPETLPLEHSAPLLCAGITMYSPLAHFGAKAAGSKFNVGVIGLGGLGDMGVKLSKAMGNKVTVISTSERKREYAEKTLGVDFINSGRDSKSLRAMQRKHGNKFDLILCTISANFNLTPYLGLVKTNGFFCILGAPTRPLELNSFLLLSNRRSVCGSNIGGIRETQEMLDFCAEHQLWSEVEHIKASEVNRAFQELGTNSSAKQRFVIDVEDSLLPGDWEIDSKPLTKCPPHIVNPRARIIGAENTAGKTYYPEKDVFLVAEAKM